MSWKDISIALAQLSPVIGVVGVISVAAISIATRRKASKKASAIYKDAVATETAEPISLHPEIDPVRCAGCGACVKVCPEGDILQMINHRAVLVTPMKCVGHGECEQACPFSAITLVFGTKTRGMELPRVTGNYETNVKGLYIAGELGGMGLIRNAVKQGKLAAEHALTNLGRSGKADFDLLVVGAGAAGLSASLAAIQAKRSYLCIEQGSTGGTIFNFPRQKVVMTHAAELPLVGKMEFPKNKVSKEELLSYWNGIRKKTGLKIKEGCKFLDLKKEGDVFHVRTNKGEVTTRKVVLAMGVRGSPRKLNIPGENLPKVTYNLIEPEQYQKMHVAVVGGGNAGVEAAQALADPKLRNKVTLLVRGKSMDRANQENKDKTNAMAKAGLIKICYESSVKEVHPEHLIVEQAGKLAKVSNHYLFIFAGAEMPFAFLQGLGIKIDKKFGEARPK
jgi:thioredoxin reductase/NAD-dependent dihydropyrimidine dehydrogenase PreA subunit